MWPANRNRKLSDCAGRISAALWRERRAGTAGIPDDTLSLAIEIADALYDLELRVAPTFEDLASVAEIIIGPSIRVGAPANAKILVHIIERLVNAASAFGMRPLQVAGDAVHWLECDHRQQAELREAAARTIDAYSLAHTQASTIDG